MAIEQQIEVEFSKDGRVYDETQVASLLGALPNVTDLFVVSHGWNNDMADARDLYDRLFQSVSDVINAAQIGGLAQRRFAVMRIFWPSKKFANSGLVPGGGAATATAENYASLNYLLERLKDNPSRLGATGEYDAIRTQNLTVAQNLIGQLEASAEARRQYILLLRTILDPSQASTDDSSAAFFQLDPEVIFQLLSSKVDAPQVPGGAGVGAAASVSDLFEGIIAAARRIADLTTYYEMKQRAGIVGSTGVAQVILRVREKFSNLKIHLIGHSFGGRLVTAAASHLTPDSKEITLSLLQAAFSHNGLAPKYDGSHDGFFRTVLGERRISGPTLITHTKNDLAVGIAYPLASRLSADPASDVGDQNDPYGGMGRNGALHTPEAVFGDLEEIGVNYGFEKGKVYNLKGDRFIGGHSDVTGHQIAHALLNVVAST